MILAFLWRKIWQIFPIPPTFIFILIIMILLFLLILNLAKHLFIENRTTLITLLSTQLVIWAVPGTAGALFSQLLPGWSGALAAGLTCLAYTALSQLIAAALRVSLTLLYLFG